MADHLHCDSNQRFRAWKLSGAGRRVEPLKTAVELGAIDRFDTDLNKAAEHADVVLLAVPMAAMRPVMETIQPALKKWRSNNRRGQCQRQFYRRRGSCI